MDPETGLDAVRNVGIRDGKIARIAAEALSGQRVIHAQGLVIAPGFIDLHQHGQDLASQRVKALDGVTTALELEIGAPDVAAFLKAKQDRSLINFGTSASYLAARAQVFGAPLAFGSLLPKSSRPRHAATPAQIEAIQRRLGSELDAGGLAVGMGIEYARSQPAGSDRHLPAGGRAQGARLHPHEEQRPNRSGVRRHWARSRCLPPETQAT